MLSLLPIKSVISWIAKIYAFLSLITLGIVVALSGGSLSLWTTAKFAFSGSFILEFVLFLWFYYGWRRFWIWFPKLNEWLYPDISGYWDMDIKPRGDKHEDTTIKAEANIRQDFLRISMDVKARDSNSNTIAAIPKKNSESGLPQLHYIFLVTTNPKPYKTADTYMGAAILNVGPLEKGGISGNYWTAQETSGFYELYKQRPNIEYVGR